MSKSLLYIEEETLQKLTEKAPNSKQQRSNSAA